MNPENRRILVASVLVGAIWLAFMWMQPKQPLREAKRVEPAVAKPAAPSQAAPPLEVKPVPSAPEELVSLETPEFKATFTTLGGALKSLELKGRKFQREVKGSRVQVDLVEVAEGGPWPGSLVPSAELGGTGKVMDDPAALGSMRIAAKDEKSVTFEGVVGTAQVRKRFFVKEKPYELGLELSAKSGGKGTLTLLEPGYVAPNVEKPGFFSAGQPYQGVTPLCRAGEKTKRFDEKEALEVVGGRASWLGLDQTYFVSSSLPTPEMGECLFYKGTRPGSLGSGLRLPLDGQLDVTFNMFRGPKQMEALRAMGRDLESAIDYGAVANLFGFFSRILLYVMRALHGLVADWGLAIVLLTFLVKLVLYPLTAKSMKSMNEMRLLQPEVDKLKLKYGDDKEKMNIAVMQLYQQHKVNPLGGCLPMLIQMPIWFALYATLQTSVELYHEPFLWLQDLTQYDPYYILPLAMGASSFIMQKISPQPADNTQAKMLLYVMPIFFTVIMLKLPSGLTLYILVNNVLSIAQQQWLMRRQGPAEPAKA